MVSGDQLHRLERFALHKAHKLLLLSENDETNFEVASLLLKHDPQLGPKIVYHVSNLRFLRVLEGARVVEQCTTFNQYELAATQLVRERLMRRFRETKYIIAQAVGIGWIIPVVHKAISLPIEQIKAATCPDPQPAGAIFE